MLGAMNELLLREAMAFINVECERSAHETNIAAAALIGAINELLLREAVAFRPTHRKVCWGSSRPSCVSQAKLN